MLPLSHSRDTISFEIKSTLYLQPVDSQMNIKTPSKFAKLRATWVVGSKNRKEKARKMSVYSTLICSLWWYSSNWHWDCDSGCSDSPWVIEADYRADKTELRFASNQRRMEWLPSQGLGRGYPLTLRFTTCDTGNSIILQKRCGRQPPKWICWIVTFNNKYVKIIYFLYW